MSFQVSARKWRPQVFDEVIGQPHITVTLRNAIGQGKIAQAYVFSGMRGVGKTTMARILAKGLNCNDRQQFPCNACDSCLEITEGRSVDVVEIDGASNTGVDDIRELREMVKYLPLRGKYKVYIIDEVHMLSTSAFNALLKTIEEPPPHLVFVLATTAPHKIPVTILSRCQHFTFRRISRAEIVRQLRRVAQERGAALTEEGMYLIAKAAEGSMRDALSLLDQAISYAGDKVSEEDLLILLGRMGTEKIHLLLSAIHRQDAVAILGLAKEISDRGYDVRQFLSDWLEYLRHLIIAQNVEGIEACVDLPIEEMGLIRSEAALFTREEMQRLFGLFAKLYDDIRNISHAHIYFEVALLKAILLPRLEPLEKIIQKIEAMGNMGATPVVSPPPIAVFAQERVPTILSEAPKQAAKQGGQSPSAIPSHDIWKRVLAEIKEQRPPLGSYLEQGVFVECSEGTLKIGFSQGAAFLVPLIQKEENTRWIGGLLTTHFQKEIRMVCIDIPSKKEDVPVQERARDLVTPHPLIGEAIKVFGGKIVETKIKK